MLVFVVLVALEIRKGEKCCDMTYQKVASILSQSVKYPKPHESTKRIRDFQVELRNLWWLDSVVRFQ
jgi:hypothetical protein